jgi:hypothetical protein
VYQKSRRSKHNSDRQDKPNFSAGSCFFNGHLCIIRRDLARKKKLPIRSEPGVRVSPSSTIPRGGLGVLPRKFFKRRFQMVALGGIWDDMLQIKFCYLIPSIFIFFYFHRKNLQYVIFENLCPSF